MISETNEIQGESTRVFCAANIWGNRARRVTLLGLAIIALSLGDLAVTLEYLHANWMMEANPIAAYLIQSTQSPLSLACFKGLTVLVCVALLYRVRRHLAAEIAAWCAVAILTGMSVMWSRYSQHFNNPNDVVLASAVTGDDFRLGLP